MQKIYIVLLFSLPLFGLDFSEFYKKAIKNSPYLQGNELSLKQAKLEAKKLTRYQNPSLELEYTRFEDGNGGRVAYSQPIRLWGVGDAADALAERLKENAQDGFVFQKALFAKELILRYLVYKEAAHLEKLSNEETKIAQTIYKISKERFANGTIPKSDTLQAKLTLDLSLTKQDEAKLRTHNAYYAMIAFSGLDEDMAVDTAYEVILQNPSISSHPLIGYKHATADLYEAKGKLYSNKIEWVEVYGEYEKEPQESIYRVGLNIPLALFNQKNEERRYALLEARRNELLAKNIEKKVTLDMLRLQKERTILQNLLMRYRQSIKEGEELIHLYQEAYKIANIDIVQLQQAKNALIQTKKALIETTIKLERNALEQNYLQGVYNEN